MDINRYMGITVTLLFLFIFPAGLFAAGRNSSAEQKKIFNITEREIHNFLAELKEKNPALYNSYKDKPDALESLAINGVIKSRSGTGSEEAEARMLKKMYNIDEPELQRFLDKIKNSDPQYYELLMKQKESQPALYQLNLIKRVSEDRLKAAGLSAADEKSNDIFKSIQVLNSEIAAERKQYSNTQSESEKQACLGRLKGLLAKRYDLSAQAADEQMKRLKEQIQKLEKSQQERAGDKDRRIEEQLKALK